MNKQDKKYAILKRIRTDKKKKKYAVLRNRLNRFITRAKISFYLERFECITGYRRMRGTSTALMKKMIFMGLICQ